jgi:phosphate transport system substrate-binding protein
MSITIKSKKYFSTVIFVSLSAILLFYGCNFPATGDNAAQNVKPKAIDDKVLEGAGSTFVAPLFSKIFAQYKKDSSITINYKGIGSGGGIVEIINKMVDFGGSDLPLNDVQTQNIGVPVLHVPMALGADVITYNLGSFKDTLNLTADVIAKIFLGEIKYWDDKEILKLNPKAKVPDLPIQVVHRSDGSGTTYIFTDYLSKVNNEWKAKVGTRSLVDWPVGIGAKGSDGVSETVKARPGSIGYLAVTYAVKNKLNYARIQNKAGKFTLPTLNAITAAANVSIPEDSKVSITNTDAPDGYPISSFTWAIVYKEQHYNKRSPERAKRLIDLLWYNVHNGQQYCQPLNYAPLSSPALTVAENILKSATYDGQPVLK